MTGPYRESPAFLICPRCGEILDRAFDDVLACLRCKGIFITPPTAGLAFGDPTWPKDTSAMWWKSSLECPVCASEGATTIMAAQTFEGTQIDRCAMHGLWLDAGELSRLAKTTGDELSVLRSKLHGDGADGNELDTKRAQLRRDVEERQKTFQREEAQRATARAKQIEEADRRHEEERRAKAEQQRTAPRVPQGPLWDAPPPAKPEPRPPQTVWPSGRQVQVVDDLPRPYAPELTSIEQLERERWLGERRAEAVAAIGTLENELIEARSRVREIEGKLAAQRTQLRALLDDS